MSVDHLVFNRLNWFNIASNANSVKANGKGYYVIPSRINVPASSPMVVSTQSRPYSEWKNASNKNNRTTTMTFSVAYAKLMYFSDIGEQLAYFTEPNDKIAYGMYVLAKDVQIISGGVRLLYRLYSKLKQALRKVVIL